MGQAESRINSGACSSSAHANHTSLVDFPNSCRRGSEATAWTLLHQCALEKWKEGHAEAAAFNEMVLTCDGALHKDCSFSFCTSRQGIININNNTSIFSFRKRSKFAKMAEHFEYNHIPAQMSSVHNFRVKSVLCFRDSLVILHLSRNSTSQFGLLDLRVNKFICVFGKQNVEFRNEIVNGEISPDKSKCLILMPQATTADLQVQPDAFVMYDLRNKCSIAQCVVNFPFCHFCFDPRYTWQRIAVTNFAPNQHNSLSVVSCGATFRAAWQTLHTNDHVVERRTSLYPGLKDLRYTRDGSLIIATILDVRCFCREKRTHNYRPINCSIYVFNSDSTDTMHCIEYMRFTCTRHYCPVNYTPTFSASGARMALVMNYHGSPREHFVQVYKLPTVINLQNMCRIIILQTFSVSSLTELPLPIRLINYLHFKPELE